MGAFMKVMLAGYVFLGTCLVCCSATPASPVLSGKEKRGLKDAVFGAELMSSAICDVSIDKDSSDAKNCAAILTVVIEDVRDAQDKALSLGFKDERLDKAAVVVARHATICDPTVGKASLQKCLESSADIKVDVAMYVSAFHSLVGALPNR